MFIVLKISRLLDQSSRTSTHCRFLHLRRWSFFSRNRCFTDFRTVGGSWWLGLVVRRLCGYILRCSAFVKVSAVSPILDDTWQSPLQADFWLCNGFTNQSCPGRLRNGDSSRDCCHHRSLVLQNGTWFRYVDDSHACLKKNKEHFTNIWTQSMLTFSSLWNLKTLTGMADLSLTPSNQDAARKFKWRLRGSQPKSKSWAVPETVFHLNRGKDKSKSSSARPEGGRGRLIRILLTVFHWQQFRDFDNWQCL